MIKLSPKALSYTGKVIIILALVIVALRSYTIAIFDGLNYNTFLAPAGKVLEPNKNDFSFAVMSDSGAMDEILERVIRKANKTNAKFVLYLGDLIRYRNPSHFKWIAEELTEELHGLPFYMVPGNHEVLSSSGAADRKVYSQMFGQTHYWFSYGDTLFIGLDTAEEKIDEEQFIWLQEVLNSFRGKYKYCIIFTHVPPINPIGERFRQLDNYSREKLAQIIKDKDISLILSGHVHYYSQTTFEGIPLITTPSSGQKIRGVVDKYGYVEVNVSDDKIISKEIYYDKKVKDKQSTIEIFFSSAIVKKSILQLSLLMLFLGSMLLLVGRKIKYK